MPRGPLSAEARAKISAAQKRRWRRGASRTASTPSDQRNGLYVEASLILHVQGHELTLSPSEARVLRAALDQALPTEPKSEQP